MVHKKYTYKDGKRFGPYYYETKRIDGQVVTTYLGTSLPHKKIHLSLIKNILIVLAFVLLVVSAYFISSTITGNVSLDIKTNYNFGEQIAGNLELNVLEGELIPADSIVLVSYGNFSKEFILSDLISSEKIEGSFYADGLTLEGQGLGYGLAGKKVEYPEIKFDFYVIDGESSSSSGSSEESVEESSQEANVENTETESVSSEPSESSEDSSESQSSESVGITGAVISDSNIISGKVSKENDYSYSLNEGDSAELVSGSVFYGNEQLDDGSIKFSTNSKEVIVTTDYSIKLEGFGSEYVGKDSILLNIDIEKLGLIADKEDDFKISLIYDNSVIVESSESISLSDVLSDIESPNSESEVIISPNESTNSSIVDIVNETLTNSTSNETITNQTQVENVTSINQTVINETLVEVKIVQYGAVIGQPVKWVKTVSADSNDGLNLTVEIPASAENVTVNKIIEEDYAEDVQDSDGAETDIVIGITGEVTADIDLRRESFFEKIFKFFRITGRVIDDESDVQEISVELAPEDLAVEVEYYTGAPIALENVVHDNFKTVSVSSPDDVHYENVLVYTSISDSSKIRDISSVKIEWVENNTVLNASSFNDTNLDGYIDYIEWIAPHLSNQTFNIILIISALHLDENRNFISDIYNETRELDGIWSETIPDSHYVRVTFEINLTNINDITIFPRASDGTNISDVIIDVYEKGSNYSLVQFSNLKENEYNKVFLTNLNGSQDTFDLLVSGGSVDFDHIIDPITRLNGPSGDVDVIPINNVTFVVAYVNVTGNLTQFHVMNPNGTVVTGPITVSRDVGLYSRVALAPINETKFAIAWVNQSSNDELSATYYTNGTIISNPVFWDGAIGNNRYDVGLAQIGNSYGYCYVDQAEGDVDFIDFFNNGTRVTGHGELDLDTGSTPEMNRGNVVDCAGINSTSYGVAWYDAGAADDILFRVVRSAGPNLNVSGIRVIDAAVGTSAAVAMTNLDANRTVVVFYDNADQDITMTIIGHDNSTYLAATDIETNAGTASSVDVVTVRNQTHDYFVAIWYNKSTEDIVGRGYYGNGNAITGPFKIEDSPQIYTGVANANGTFPLFAAAGRDSITGNSLCPGTFVVSYTNLTNASLVKSFWLNGSEWDGACTSTLTYPSFGAFNETTLNNSAYVSGALYRFNITITNSNGSAGFEFNGVNRSVTNLTATMFNTSILDLGAGIHSYYWWSYGPGGSYNISGLRNYVVARNSTPILNLTFNGTQSNIYPLNNTSLLINGSLILGDSSSLLRLYKNGTQINQAAIEVSNSTIFNTLFGPYNITVFYNQSQNYTESFRTYNVTVLPNSYKNITLVDAPLEFVGSGASIDHAYATTGNAEILIVQVVSWGPGGTDNIPDGVVFDGSSLERVGSGVYNPTPLISSEIYYLTSPSIGDDLRLTINYPGAGPSTSNVAAFTLNGINLTHPLENHNYTNTSLWNVTTHIQTSAYKSWLVDALAVEGNSLTPEASIVQTMNLDTGTSVAGYKENVFPGLNSMTWTWGTSAQNVAHIVASFRPAFDLDTLSPTVRLNGPANNSLYNLTDFVNFNWTAFDDRDTSMLCNLTIAGAVNRSNVVSPNNTAINLTIAGFPIGTHAWNVTCYDDALNSGFNGTRRFTVLNLIPFNGTPVILNSTLGINRTLENLNVATTLLDLNNHTMNVTVRWYNNSILHLTENYNGNYANGTNFVGFLDHRNTTKEHTWYANITITDGYNTTASFISNNLTILDSPPNITLLTPPNNSVLVNYTDQNYTWAMGDVDAPEFVAVIAGNFSSLAISSCDDPVFRGDTAHSIPTADSYYFAHPVMLECPTYLWSIIGFSTVLGDWAPYFRINVTGNIPNITLNSPVNNTAFIIGDVVNFNWTTRDNNSTFSANSTCNLTIDGVPNKTSINSPNYINPPNYISNNITSNGFTVGVHHWNMTCFDFVGNSNYSQIRTFTFYDRPNVTFISPTPATDSVQSANAIFTNLTSYGGSYHTSFIDLNRDLLLWLRFDNLNASNDPLDSSTYSRNGSKFGNAIQNNSGYFGKGFGFDGNGDYVEVPGQIYDLDQGTLSLWFKNLGDNGGNNVITGSVDGGDNRAPTIYISGGQFLWEFKDLTAQAPGVEIVDGEWYHAVLTYNLTGGVALYINGDVVDQELSGGDGLDFYDTFYVGRYGNFGSLFFNGTVDDVIVLNRSITQSEVRGLYATPSSSIDYYNRNFTGLSAGSYVFNATVQDSFGNINNSLLRVNISSNVAPYNGTSLIINSTIGLNRTKEDIHVRTLLLDQNNNAMNVTVRWYNNSILHLTQNYNSNYANGTTFIATLDDGNTTKGHNWTAGLSISDGLSQFNVNSTALMIRNTPPNSTLLTPANGSITLNRTNQNFTWVTSDDDGDPYSEEFNLTYFSTSTCVDSLYDGSSTFLVENEPNQWSLELSGSGPLKCLIDNGDYYLWDVRASDDESNGNPTIPFRFDVQAYLNFVMNISSVEFGNLGYLRFNDTVDNSPRPIIMINQGNVKADGNIGASSLWSSVSNPSANYQFKVDNATTNGISENVTFRSTTSTVTYTNIPLYPTTTLLVGGFNYTDNVDSMEVDLNVTVPSTEGPGFKNSTITFLLSLSTEEQYA